MSDRPYTYVKFISLVTVGGLQAQDHWSSVEGLGGPGVTGKTVVSKGEIGLLFTWTAGPNVQEVEVPWSNIAHATKAYKVQPAQAKGAK